MGRLVRRMTIVVVFGILLAGHGIVLILLDVFYPVVDLSSTSPAASGGRGHSPVVAMGGESPRRWTDTEKTLDSTSDQSSRKHASISNKAKSLHSDPADQPGVGETTRQKEPKPPKVFQEDETSVKSWKFSVGVFLLGLSMIVIVFTLIVVRSFQSSRPSTSLIGTEQLRPPGFQLGVGLAPPAQSPVANPPTNSKLNNHINTMAEAKGGDHISPDDAPDRTVKREKPMEHVADADFPAHGITPHSPAFKSFSNEFLQSVPPRFKDASPSWDITGIANLKQLFALANLVFRDASILQVVFDGGQASDLARLKNTLHAAMPPGSHKISYRWIPLGGADISALREDRSLSDKWPSCQRFRIVDANGPAFPSAANDIVFLLPPQIHSKERDRRWGTYLDRAWAIILSYPDSQERQTLSAELSTEAEAAASTNQFFPWMFISRGEFDIDCISPRKREMIALPDYARQALLAL